MELVDLPSDVLFLILYETLDPNAVTTFGQCSKTTWYIVRDLEPSVFRSILSSIYGPDVFKLKNALGYNNTAGQDRNLYSEPFTKPRNRDENSLARSSRAELNSMARLHTNIERVSNDYHREILQRRCADKNELMSMQLELSGSERVRLRRALLHYETICRTCRFIAALDGDRDVEGVYRNLADELPAWELDELLCVVLHLESWWAEVIGDFVGPDAINRLVHRIYGSEIARLYTNRYYSECAETVVFEDFRRQVEQIPLLRLSDLNVYGVPLGCASSGLQFYCDMRDLGSWTSRQELLNSWCEKNMTMFTFGMGHLISCAACGTPAQHVYFLNTHFEHQRNAAQWTGSTSLYLNMLADHPSHANAGWRWINRSLEPSDGDFTDTTDSVMSPEDDKELVSQWTEHIALVPMNSIGNRRYNRLSSIGLWLWDARRLARWSVNETTLDDFVMGFDLWPIHLSQMTLNNAFPSTRYMTTSARPGYFCYLRYAPPKFALATYYCDSKKEMSPSTIMELHNLPFWTHNLHKGCCSLTDD